ncbi:PilZ domain-containing protein [Thalassotalea sp. HSM 43]|uniref:PilZ domain-containing protein n=1 Tax=Thalassotalea sp. HSM 43 TaxID=2552945 RepID=UPI001080E1D6|nr:PilZ domain-containing protein [Thalassotalea sp. HSM 43]QBY03915.1 PilZ domain-containing protein [Thalassotalea sp. HSM 43]
MFSDRRIYPRKELEIDVDVMLLGDDVRLTTSSRNLSLSGIQISADKALVDHLLQQEQRPVHFDLCFDGHPDLSFHCRLVVNRRISHNDFLLGIKFMNNSLEHTKLIQQLLSTD